MLDVFARYEYYGLTSGVWHILSTPPDIHNPRLASSLCVRFGLEQEVLDAAIAQIVDTTVRGWDKKLGGVIKAETGIDVKVFKSNQECKAYGRRLRCMFCTTCTMWIRYRHDMGLMHNVEDL